MRFASRCCLMILLTCLFSGCSQLRVKLTGDKGVRYQAAWNGDSGNQARRGSVPVTFKFKEENLVGWFQNASSSGEFRVRVYQGWSLLVDETVNNSAQRISVEKKGHTVSVGK